jgi:hypothetical protein
LLKTILWLATAPGNFLALHVVAVVDRDLFSLQDLSRGNDAPSVRKSATTKQQVAWNFGVDYFAKFC